MVEKHKKVLILAASILFLLFCLLIGYYIGIPMVQLAEDPSAFQAWVDSYGILGRILFVGMVILQVVIAFIPGEPIELAAGYAFGFWEGTLLTLIGFMLGSLLVFILVRKFGITLVEVFFAKDRIHRFSFLQNPQKTRTLAFLFMLIPGTPKDFLSYFAGLTKLKLSEWLLIVAVGRLPSLVSSTATGAVAGSRNYILSAIILGITCILAILGVLYYRWICKQEIHNNERRGTLP